MDEDTQASTHAFDDVDEDLDPVAVIEDGEGWSIEVWSDGSWCTKHLGRLVPSFGAAQ